VRSGRSDRQVVVESSDWTGVVGENSLGGQEWVEGLNWSALQRERSPLDRHERPQRFQRFPLDRSRSVVDSVVGHRLDGLFYGLYQRLGVVSMLGCWLGMVSCWLGMVGCWLGMVGSVCAMLSMVGSMSGMFSRLLAMVGVVVVVVMIVTVSRDHREHH
jgi:hypothetical protein